MENNKNMVNCKSCGKSIAKKAKKCVHCGADNRNFFQKHKIISAFLFLILLGSLGNLLPESENVEEVKQAVAEEAVVEEAVVEEAVVEEAVVEVINVSADVMIAEYKSNEIRGDQLYKGKLVRVEGIVDSISTVLGTTYITLKSNDEFEFMQVQCFFDKDYDMNRLAQASKGRAAAISGYVDGLGMNVEMSDCNLEAVE